MPIQSAGVLLYRARPAGAEVLLIHPKRCTAFLHRTERRNQPDFALWATPGSLRAALRREGWWARQGLNL